MPVNTPLTGTQKTNITAVETALNTALASLPNSNDTFQAACREVLDSMARLLEHIRVERQS